MEEAVIFLYVVCAVAVFLHATVGLMGKDGAVCRRRINPMYEALEKSATRLYARTCHRKMQSSAQRQLRYLWCAFIVTIFINIFLLAVIAYILFLLIPSKHCENFSSCISFDRHVISVSLSASKVVCFKLFFERTMYGVFCS